MTNWYKVSILLAAFVVASGSIAQASPVLSWTGGTWVPSVSKATDGWQFLANQDLHVSDLMWYDPTGKNLAQHPVAIWDSVGTVMGTACVGYGCAGSFYAAGYWQTPVSFNLAPGRYDIAGWLDVGDPFVWYGSTVTTDPAITFLMPVGWAMPSIGWPDDHTCCGAIGFFGPNFVASPVPEPTSLTLAGVGAAAAFWRRHRTRNR